MMGGWRPARLPRPATANHIRQAGVNVIASLRSGVACMGITMSRPTIEDRGRINHRGQRSVATSLTSRQTVVNDPGGRLAACRDPAATCLYTVGSETVRNHDAEYASTAAVQGGGSILPFGVGRPCHLNGLPPPRFAGAELQELRPGLLLRVVIVPGGARHLRAPDPP